MSKRYGRNQRRQHREQIADLTTALVAESTTARTQTRRANDLEHELADWNNEIISLLGRHTALQRTTPTMKVRDVRDFQAMPAPTDMRAAMRVAIMKTASSMTDMVTIERILMHKLFAQIADNIEPLRLIIRLKIEGGGESRYAMSDELMRHGLTDRDIRYFADDIARQLAHHLNGQRRR